MIFNPRSEATSVTLPDGKWNIYINGEDAGNSVLATAQGEVSVEPISAMVLVKENAPAVEQGGFHPGFLLPVLAAVIAMGAVSVAMLKKKK